MNGTYSLSEFQKVAEAFTRSLAPRPNRATVVGLYGDLGAGKTTFAQAVAHALGIHETVNSPTFLILKSYPVKSLRSNGAGKLVASSYKLLHHIDAYRLKHSDELRKLRFEELLADPANLILIEWADKVADLLPPDSTKVFLEFVDDATRRVTFS